jgi:siderophore synthetase component
MGIPIFIPHLLTIAEPWNESWCPTMDEWIKKMLSVFISIYYLPIIYLYTNFGILLKPHKNGIMLVAGK